MSGLPVDSSHLSAFSRADMIDQYGGAVEVQFAKASVMREFVRVRPIRGTDTLVDRRMGRTTLQKVTDGVRPDASATAFGKVTVTVDTIALARDNRALLNEFQTDFDARMELGQDHGKEIGKFFDQAHIILAIKGAQLSAPTGTHGASFNGAFGAGKTQTLAGAGDELDPDKFYAKIKAVVQAMEEEDIDPDELILFMRPTQYNVLLDHTKLVSVDFSQGNADFAGRTIMQCAGVRIEKSTRIPTTATPATEHHILSNVENSYAYDVDATDAKAKAVFIHPKSLLSGETIPMTSDVYYEKTELQWFIDSYIAFGVAVNRPDVCGAVFAA